MALKKKNIGWGQNGFEDWGGYMEAKKAKLEEQFNEEAKIVFKNASDLFQGIAIFVNGYTDPKADELRRLMMEYGGTYHHYMRPKVTTHIIASNLPYSKIMLYKKVQCPIPICKPEWITDSIKAGKVLNCDKYLLCTNCSDNQPQLNFKKINEKTKNINSDANKTNTIQSTKTVISDNVAPTTKESNLNEENAKEKSRINGTALSSKNSEFISEFYNNSRLHHIATMSATFKNYVNELRDKSNGQFPGLEKLKKWKESNKRPDSPLFDDLGLSQDELFTPEENQNVPTKQEPVIMHIDMDCFFVSVGLRNRPHLKGLPVAVTHAKGNKKNTDSKSNNMNNNEQDEEEHGSLSEIASCSYEARKAGVKNGMFLGQALKICPQLQTMKYDFEAYKEVSYTLYDTVASYTLDIEAVSCDEMYADCTKILEESGLTPMEFAKIIRDEIREKTSCPVSTGFGSNKLRARLATKKAKPDGQFYLEDTNAISHIDTFNVQDLPGVGYTTTQKLHGMNINTCAQLRSISLRTLQKDFGKKMGELLYNMCRGIDKTKLNLEHIRKSVSAEVNYGIRFEDNAEAVGFLKKLCVEVQSRLTKANAKGRSITLKLMVRAKDAPIETAKFMGHGPCDYITKSKNLIAPIDDLIIVTREIISLWNQLHQKPEDIRGIGIQISRLEIQKNKSNGNNILNFFNKNKEPQVTHLDLNECRNNESDKNTKHKELKTFFVTTTETSTTNSTDTSSKLNNPHSKNIQINTIETSSTNNNKIDPQKNLVSTTVVPSPDQSIILLPSQGIHDSILNELPEEIRSEILEATKKKENLSNNKSKSQIDANKDKKINTERDNLEQNMEIDENIKVQNIAANALQSQNSVTKQLPTENIKQNDVKHLISHQNESSSDAYQDFVLSQEIDENTLNELPENIRNEIINTMLKKKNKSNDKTKTEKGIQTRQEQYFKQIKPSSGKITKTELPPIQEIDMSVMLELPENIRNEIFNQYKNSTHQNTDFAYPSVSNEQKNKYISIKNTTESVKKNTENISFSQVDPDFLAALPTDMQYDVQQYCNAKKKENQAKDNLPNKTIVNNKLTKTWSVLQYDKNAKPLSKSKNNGKNSKATSNKNNRKKDTKAMPKVKERKNEYEVETIKVDNNLKKTKSDNEDNNIIRPSTSTTNNIDQHKDIVNENDAILAHTVDIISADKNTDKYQNTIITNVNNFFNLTVEQIRMQIQAWINTSDTVNEMDYLSVATFLSMLPEKRRIEDLHILLKTMHRCTTNTGNCIWHKTYGETVKHVQRYMQIKYNSNLIIPPIKCDCFDYNKDVI